eukprot:TRINITY_DN1241_c0_g1_i4.p2 TRINITY_DN1241_c0_g1~~TRINITY_DN1241_c0_g1_i4.p2  ORF type:complete len:200 (-),score=53.84 TRINITY_DN1241_c0_g1_i4:1160-1759(-)
MMERKAMPCASPSLGVLADSCIAAIASGDLHTLQQVLRECSSIDGCVEDLAGRSPVNWAAREGRADMVRALLQYGMQVDGPRQRVSSLVRAAHDGQHEIVCLLLPHSSQREKDAALRSAAACSHVSVVRALADAGADVRASDVYGRTALLLVASELVMGRRGQEEDFRCTFDVLLDHGAIPCAQVTQLLESIQSDTESK